MTPEFRFEKSWDEWQSVRSPDNIDIEVVISEEQSCNICASLLDLADLYELIHSKEECDMMIGTGTIIQIQSCNGKVKFTLNETHAVTTTFDQLEQAIDELLQEIFSSIEGNPTRIPEYQREEYPQIEELYNKITE